MAVLTDDLKKQIQSLMPLLKRDVVFAASLGDCERSAKMREIGYLCLELAIAANKKQHKKTDLTRFNVQHEFLRQLLNLAVEAQHIEPRRHRIACEKLDEVGKLLGGWLRSELRADS